jgi:hypothetical protein
MAWLRVLQILGRALAALGVLSLLLASRVSAEPERGSSVLERAEPSHLPSRAERNERAERNDAAAARTQPQAPLTAADLAAARRRLPAEPATKFRCAVRRYVIADDEFVISKFLSQNTLNRAWQKVYCIIRRNTYADFGHGCLYYVLPIITEQ